MRSDHSPAIDWNERWQAAHRRRRSDRNDREFWNKRAPSFASHARESGYVRDFLGLVRLSPDHTVLDVGCGAGTLAIPLSGRVRSITALDFSANMLQLLEQRCRENGITNVTRRLVGWEDDWDAAGIDVHDVAIASRSLVVNDLASAIAKLSARARQRVIITSLVGDGPFDRRIFTAIGRELDRGPDYIYVYNLLHQMGIRADVTFVGNNGEEPKSYPGLDEAVDGLHWMLGELSGDEEEALRRYLRSHLVPGPGGYVLDYRHPIQWAVISWNKKEAHP